MNSNKQLYGAVLLKADRILSFLSSSDSPQRLNQIAAETGLTNSTALKILDTLIHIGYVEKDPEAKKFSLGPSIIKYANKGIQKLDIKRIAQPHIEKLQRITTETVHLGILDISRIVYITKLESSNPVSLYSKVGKSIPLYCSAMGKSILAEQTDDEIEKYLANHALIPKTKNTITSEKIFLQEIENVRKQGFAFDNSEHEDEVFCIGTSLSLNGKTYGAISVSVPKYRINAESKNAIIQAVKTCKTEILNDII